MKESAVEKAIFTFLKARGIFVFKVDKVGLWNQKAKAFMTNHNPNRIKGVSDILGLLPDGRFLAIEVKTPKTETSNKGYPTKEQVAFIEKVNSLGGLAFIARSIEDVKLGLNGYI